MQSPHPPLFHGKNRSTASHERIWTEFIRCSMSGVKENKLILTKSFSIQQKGWFSVCVIPLTELNYCFPCSFNCSISVQCCSESLIHPSFPYVLPFSQTFLHFFGFFHPCTWPSLEKCIDLVEPHSLNHYFLTVLQKQQTSFFKALFVKKLSNIREFNKLKTVILQDIDSQRDLLKKTGRFLHVFEKTGRLEDKGQSIRSVSKGLSSQWEWSLWSDVQVIYTGTREKKLRQ